MNEIKNLQASIKDRLLNIAKRSNRDFNAVLLQYLQERFLYRLSRSQYSDNLILKGALLLLVNDLPLERPTKDIDLLGSQMANTEDKIEEVISNIITITSNDGVEFDSDSITIEQITQESKYNGYRVAITGYLGSAKRKIQIDIGFGDEIIPSAETMDYPTFLDLPVPKVKAYSIESAISEKLEAIVRFNYYTSRMKDFYDIWYLSQSCKFRKSELKNAILTTFENRETEIEDISIIFKSDFKNNNEKKSQCQAFLERNAMELDITFQECINTLQKFIKPIFKEGNGEGIWNEDKQEWEKI